MQSILDYKVRVFNLTQHDATPEQIEQGVTELYQDDKILVAKLLTFDEIPTKKEIEKRASEIASIAASYTAEKAMIGGAPFLMRVLEDALTAARIRPVYAFSTRVSIEALQPDGSVRKTQVFKHLGFV